MSTTAAPIYLRQLEIGPMQNYVYLVGDPQTREAAVIDAAWDIPAILDVAEADGMKITKALVTHFHPDHLGGRFAGMSVTGASELVARLPVKVYINKHEAPYVGRVSDLSASDLVAVDTGDSVAVGNVPITFVHTPGHTPGSQCFLAGGNLISGDTLFIGGCGRTDLPGSDPEAMYRSLNDTLRNLPDDTVVYPGHNYANRPTSTIANEKRHNLYMRFESVDDFLRFVGR
jgi:hydroxyacylglutathione hydrolase